jgi:hypothetical protein
MVATKIGLWLIFALTVFMLSGPAGGSLAATNLKLNPSLDYTSDSNDGPLITGDSLSDGSLRKGTPAYLIFYHRECYNSKRQARRTVELYEKYMGKVDFIIVDLDTDLSKEQEALRSRFYRNYIPHVTVIDPAGEAVYDKSGEVGTDRISLILDGLLQ